MELIDIKNNYVFKLLNDCFTKFESSSDFLRVSTFVDDTEPFKLSDEINDSYGIKSVDITTNLESLKFITSYFRSGWNGKEDYKAKNLFFYARLFINVTLNCDIKSLRCGPFFRAQHINVNTHIVSLDFLKEEESVIIFNICKNKSDRLNNITFDESLKLELQEWFYTNMCNYKYIIPYNEFKLFYEKGLIDESKSDYNLVMLNNNDLFKPSSSLYLFEGMIKSIKYTDLNDVDLCNDTFWNQLLTNIEKNTGNKLGIDIHFGILCIAKEGRIDETLLNKRIKILKDYLLGYYTNVYDYKIAPVLPKKNNKEYIKRMRPWESLN